MPPLLSWRTTPLTSRRSSPAPSASASCGASAFPGRRNWYAARSPRWAARWQPRATPWRIGFGGNLAGGTHHAFRGEGSGFCVFNDLAVAILALRRDALAARAAVIDLDVHQGDGTAAIFEHDPAVLTLSMHGEHNFPFRKQRSRIDIALADGTGDDEYLSAPAGSVAPGDCIPPGCDLLPVRRRCSGGRPLGKAVAHPGRTQAARPSGTRRRRTEYRWSSPSAAVMPTPSSAPPKHMQTPFGRPCV